MEEVIALMDLGLGKREYWFSIDRRQGPPILHIPGDHRGPDLCYPDRPEQEKWLNGLSELMTPFWHCQWKFIDDDACSTFVDQLKGGSHAEGE